MEIYKTKFGFEEHVAIFLKFCIFVWLRRNTIQIIKIFEIFVISNKILDEICTHVMP
jgi:hypothetical protein